MRGIHDFLDALLALGLLEREGEGEGGRYRNTAATGAFLDKQSPTYLGGILEMANSRLYGFWGDLSEALRTGRPQNEVKHNGKAMFDELYSDAAVCVRHRARFRRKTVTQASGGTGRRTPGGVLRTIQEADTAVRRRS